MSKEEPQPSEPTLNEILSLAKISACVALRDEAQLKSELEEALKQGLSILFIREAILQTYLFAGYPAAINGFIVLNELILRSLHDPAIHHMIKWLDEGWHAYLEQVIRAGIEQGLFRADLDPGSAATWLILLTKGTTLHYLTNPGAVDFDRIKADIEHWLTKGNN